ncbi:MAG: F0F1 ATP synthase subunit delta [Bacteroidales bacterium]|nr:F0F1 ATP synthase subunit delta [Bacteroidales bacterium]
MDEGKISVRYAHALYALAKEKGIHHEIYKEMQTMSQAFMELPELTKALANPMHSGKEKQALLTTAAGGNIDSLLNDFFAFVIKKGREEFMIFIAMSYQKYYREDQRIVVGKITSALPLKEETILKIRQLINKEFNATIELSTKIEPDIIGGFIFEVDNYQMDSSVKKALQHIQKELIRP